MLCLYHKTSIRDAHMKDKSSILVISKVDVTRKHSGECTRRTESHSYHIKYRTFSSNSSWLIAYMIWYDTPRQFGPVNISCYVNHFLQGAFVAQFYKNIILRVQKPRGRLYNINGLVVFVVKSVVSALHNIALHS